MEDKLVIGCIYYSTLYRQEYNTQGVEGPWKLEAVTLLDGILVLEVIFLDSNWRASLALVGENWHRTCTAACIYEEDRK